MTRLIQFANNAASRLAANISSSATTIVLTPGDGVKFPALSGGKYFYATLVKADGTTEVVKVTARSTDTLTVVRAADAISDATVAYAFSAGDKIELRLNAGAVGSELDRLESLALRGVTSKTGDYTVVEADTGNLIKGNTGSATITFTLPAISTLTSDFDILIAKSSGDANALTVVRSGGDLINGVSSYVLSSQYQSAWLIADRSTNTWTAINSGSVVGGANVSVDTFTGNGTQTAFTLSGDPGTINNTTVFVGGVYQKKSVYSVTGTTLTTSSAVPNGTSIEVIWTTPTTIGTPSDGTVTASKIAAGAVTTAKLATTGVTAGTYGSSTQIPQVTVNDKGQVTTMAQVVVAGVPTGAVFYFPGTAAPAGFVKLNGALLSRATYPDLYAYAVASGNMAANDAAWRDGEFSPGDGSTTFRVPDYRGSFARSYDDGRGVDTSRALGSLQLDAFQGHYHKRTGYSKSLNGQSGSDNMVEYGSPGSANDVLEPTTDGTNGSPRTASETRPRNVAALACIKC